MAEKPYEDYGHLHRKQPAKIEQPNSVTALAEVLKECNRQGKLVTLRNTGHSCNGQTLTEHVQLDLAALTERKFDRERRTVTVGPGNSWNFVLREVNFPEFCLPLFPNNPGQRIRIGGTAGVGGVGYYGSKAGGFWNAVQSMKLVTMEGEIVECSREKEFDLMRYSLGGFGRLGVIAEMTVSVVESKADVVGMLLIYRCHEDYERDMLMAMTDELFDGVAGQEDIPSKHSRDVGAKVVVEEAMQAGMEGVFDEGFVEDQLSKLDLKILTVIKEVDAKDTAGIREFVRKVRYKYKCGIMLFMKVKDSNLDVSLDITAFKKKELVYFSPRSQNFWIFLVQRVCQFLTGGVFKCLAQPEEKRDTKHPWNDCIVPLENYDAFMSKAKAIISDAEFEKNISKQSIFHGLVNVDSFVTFLIRKMNPAPDPVRFPEGNEFPLALDLPGERDVSMGLAIMPDLLAKDVSRLPQMLAMCDALTDLTYEMEGRRYLYGYHNLTRQQLIRQYGGGALGEMVIRKWNDLKKRTDPKGLLNSGVLGRELDEF